MTTLTTVPHTVEQSTLEDIKWGIDLTAQLTVTQTPTAVVCILTSPSGVAIAMTADDPVVAGKIVSQRVRKGKLTNLGNYQLAVLFTPSGTTNILETVLTIQCLL